jgi:diadenosine tetraphosphate (Ap4A) HIT family hydrolase
MSYPEFSDRASYEQYMVSRSRPFGQDDCPLCREMQQKQSHIVIWQSDSWALLYNRYPYVRDGKHVMLIPKRHIQYARDLTPEECQDLSEAYAYIDSFYGEEEYFSFTRETFGLRSVEHLHTHYISGVLPQKAIIETLVAQGYEP